MTDVYHRTPQGWNVLSFEEDVPDEVARDIGQWIGTEVW